MEKYLIKNIKKIKERIEEKEKYKYYNEKFSNLVGMKYDNTQNYTKTISQLLKSRRGICFDFVNYIYHMNNKTGRCFFIWYNNQNFSTHTIYIDEDNYRIEATPPADDIYVKKIGNIESEIKRLAIQETNGKRNDKDEPLYLWTEYVPENKVMSIKSFILKRFNEMEE